MTAAYLSEAERSARREGAGDLVSGTIHHRSNLRRLETDDSLLAVLDRPDVYEHGDRRVLIDVRTFRDGRTSGKRAHYQGRPVLAAQIWHPYIAEARRVLPGENSFQTNAWATTYLWRYLDEAEATFAAAGCRNQVDQPTVIEDVRQLPGLTFANFVIWLETHHPSKAYAVSSKLVTLIRRALDALHEAGQDVPSFNAVCPVPTRAAGRERVQPAYDLATLRAVALACRREAETVCARVAASHALADSGTDPWTDEKRLEPSYLLAPANRERVWSDANVMAFVRARLVPDPPSTSEFQRRYRFHPWRITLEPDVSPPLRNKPRAVSAGPGIVGMLRALLPTATDLVPFVMHAATFGCLNLQTIVQLRRDDWFEMHQDDPGKVTVRGIKARGGGSVDEAESSTADWSLFDTVRRAVALTAPLHEVVLRRVAQLRVLADGKMPANERRQVLSALRRYEALSNRVWLCVRTHPIGVSTIILNNEFGERASTILAHHDVRVGDMAASYSARQARRAFASMSYDDAGFDLDAVKLQMNHARRDTTTRYLDNQDVVAAETRLLRTVQNALLPTSAADFVTAGEHGRDAVRATEPAPRPRSPHPRIITFRGTERATGRSGRAEP